MKKQLTLIALLICGAGATAQNRSIKFEHGTWQEVKEKAAKEKKMIFIDCYTSWCGPCKWMAKNIFTNDTVADYFNEHFVCAKIDMEVGEGKDIAKQFKVQAYPNLIFADAKGEMVHRSCGAPNAQNLIALAKDAQTPDKTYSSLVSKYKGGNRSTDFMVSYLKATQAAYLNTNDAAAAYFATQKESDLSNRENWTMMQNYLNSMNSPTFKYLLANTNAFSQKYTADSVDMVISKVYMDTCMRIIYNPKADKKKYLELKEYITKSNFKGSEKLLLTTDMAYYQSQGDWINYAKTAEPLIDKYYLKNAGMINNVCWTFYEKVTDKAMLAKAVEWSRIGNDVEKDYPASLDTYACLLFKIGKKQEAIKTEEKALQLIKSGSEKAMGADATQYEAKITDWKK